jgi:hypothetical protein
MLLQLKTVIVSDRRKDLYVRRDQVSVKKTNLTAVR